MAFGKSRKTAAASQPGKDSAENKGRAFKGMLFLAGVVLFYVLDLIVTGQMDTFLTSLHELETGWIVAAAICYVLYYIAGVSAYAVAVWLDRDSPVGIRDLMSVEASGTFFGNLTPAMVGSVPAQILRLTNAGLDAGEATATQLTRGITQQIASVSYCAVILFVGFVAFQASYGNLIFLALIAWVIGLLKILGQLAICYFPNQVMRFGNAAVKWISKRGWLKDYGRAYHFVNNEVSELSDAFRRATNSRQGILVTLVINYIQLTLLYLIPWFVANAFGCDLNPVASIELCALVQMVGAAVPLPGGTGGVDVAWNIFLGPTFGALTTAGFIMWRAVSYIGPIFFAIPLLNLHSGRREQSLYQRWNTIAHGAGKKRRH
ncbi:MAG: YbhN family protein [Parafannyhessea sp.]|uniref:lysylphosphatidylglycerol synthase transmembrane domain-containing protein n=1 Tax=Parafannyhessea sp. TaxID=2847324 RepID=UPI003F0FC2B6